MRIKWYGTASLLIEGEKTRILIDPYLKRNKKLPSLPVDEAVTAEAVFITHPHFDHFSDISVFESGNVKDVYVSPDGIRTAAENNIPIGLMRPIVSGDRVEVGDISVRVYKGRHCKFDAATVLGIVFNPLTYCRFASGVRNLKIMKRFKMSGRDDIYAFEVQSGGKKLLVLGSAGMADDAEYPKDADMLVFPYQGRTRMDRYMKGFLRTLTPKAVIIDHFDNAFPPFTRSVNTGRFAEAAREVLPEVRTVVPTENEWYEI